MPKFKKNDLAFLRWSALAGTISFFSSAVLGPIDLNFLAIITSFGIGIGVSIGLYEKTKLQQ